MLSRRRATIVASDANQGSPSAPSRVLGTMPKNLLYSASVLYDDETLMSKVIVMSKPPVPSRLRNPMVIGIL